MGAWTDSPRISVKDGHYAGRTGTLIWTQGTRSSVWLEAGDGHAPLAVVIPTKYLRLDGPQPETSAMASARANVAAAHRSGGAA